MFPTPEEIAGAVWHLRAGRLVAFPTETVYGLGADAFSAGAVDAVFALKGRPGKNPLIVHVADVDMARGAVADWPREAQLLADAFWPGPLTIVLPKAANVPDRVTGGASNVAVRCPDHPVTLSLLTAFGGPLVGPSANPSGRVSPTAAAHVRAYFAPQQVMVLDGGACRAGIESTVVTLTGSGPRVVRLGVVGAAEIAKVLGVSVESGSESGDGTGAMPSPGMLANHYAPRTPASLVNSNAILTGLADRTRTFAVLTRQSLTNETPHTLIAMPTDAAGYAANLYAALMRADAANVDAILIERPDISDGDPLWGAIMDRLQRATA